MGRENRPQELESQPKAGMGIAYGQINESVDGEKSVQSWHRTAYGQINERGDGEKSVQSWYKNSLWADKRE